MNVRKAQRLARLRALVEKRGSPRFQMGVILICAGVVGFLASLVLLRLGVTLMALRYPLAACVGYATFLGLVWLWARYSRRRTRPETGLDVFDAIDVLDSEPARPRRAKVEPRRRCDDADDPADPDAPSDSSLTFDFPDLDLDFGDAALLLIPIAVLTAALIAAFFVISIAPVLFAEILAEGLLLGGVYRRLRDTDAESWYSVIFRRTRLPFAALVVCLATVGFAAQWLAPEARSIGDVFRT